ncbi:hypothetical protein [Streptomyces sp. NBC_01601]|uniref:hypothetical protein n=1 Tax=Streptomyces sp. NBC_01601 TaxID=2975892 RepID=UPI002E2CFF5E|nr:hypothetical protein [Streptomyces sp. NBC_01601]
MSKFKRATAAALTIAAAVGATVAIAPTADAAVSWKCSTSSRSIDDLGYDGPWPDNWDVTVRNCAARSGGYVYSYSKVSWDAPANYAGATYTFNSAYFRQYVKKSNGSVAGYATRDVEYRLEHGSVYTGNGSFTTPTIKRYVGSGRAYGDGTLKLDWYNDGRGSVNYEFAGSPSV